MKNYKIVIVLCASELKIAKNGSTYFEELNENEKKNSLEYLGGQIRMDAAVDLAERVEVFIVVGGSQKKVDDMKKYIQENLRKKGANVPPIIRIESDPDTNGNLQAIKKVLKDHSLNFKNSEVAILTNFYHIPRSLRFAADIFPEYNFIPLAAESLIIQHQPTYTLYSKEFLLRISDDIDGLRDWEADRYKEQNKLDKDVKAICYDLELLKKLLNGAQRLSN